MIMNERIALDTNILIYCHDNHDAKKNYLALDLLDCAPVLYSEDMQNGLVVEKQLKIINPFI